MTDRSPSGAPTRNFPSRWADLPRAVVFDCDGVLVDSEPAWFTGIVGTFQRHGVCQLLTGPASSLYGGSVGDVVALLEREMGEPARG